MCMTRPKKLKLGISVVIAELIILALAIAISISIYGYINGWFSFSVGKAEGIRVYPDSKIYKQNNLTYAYIHLYSNYKPFIKINKIIMDNAVAKNITIEQIIRGKAFIDNYGNVVLMVGSEVIIKVYFNTTKIVPDYDNKVELLIITEEGYLYKAVVTILNK